MEEETDEGRCAGGGDLGMAKEDSASSELSPVHHHVDKAALCAKCTVAADQCG